MKRSPVLAFLLVLLTSNVCLSQATKGSIAGHVTDATGAVIQNASIHLTPSNLSAVSGSLGEFIFPSVPPGAYTLQVASAGFSPSAQSVAIVTGQALQLEIKLTVAPGSTDIIVTSESGQNEVQAVNEEITSANILQVMPQSEIVALPNANVADAIGRMPGVTLQRNEGEGEYIQVRGLDPRLTNLTIDGVTIPSPEATVRQINLSTIPADMVQSIELNKTLSANQDADGIGGSVNLVTKKAGESATFSAESTLGYTPLESGRYMGGVDTTVGKRFGATKRLGLIFGASYDYNGRGINDIEPAPDLNPDGSTTPYYDNITLREYRFARLRWGGTLGADYKVSDRSSISAHVILSDFKDWGDKWYYEVQDQAKPKFYESNRKPDFGIGSLSVSGNHLFDKIWVSWGSAVSRSRELNSGGNPKVTFNADKALKSFDSANCNYTGTSAKSVYLPQWSAACMFPNSVPADDTFNLANYTINQFVTTSGDSVQLNLQEWGGLGFNYRLGGHSAMLEVGGEFRNGHKFQNANTPTYDYNGSATADQFENGDADPDYYSGNYHNGPFTDYGKLAAYFAANPALFPLDVSDTHLGSDPDNFDLIERVAAGYVMNTIDFGHLRLQTGLRLEATHVNAQGFITTSDVNGNWLATTPTTTAESYIDPLPSVQARWAVTNLTAVRAVYARGISRPDPYDLVPYFLDNGEGSIPRYSIGNPKEQPTHANNYDLLLEQQLRPFGVIQVGYFYKQLSDPIVAAFVPYTTENPDGYPDVAQQNVNASNASVSGLEFAWQQQFSNLPGVLHGLGIAANYAYTDSHTHGIPDRTDDPPLIGQARHAFNISPSYESDRFTAHLGISYNGANDYAYQYTNAYPDPSSDVPGGPKGPFGDNYFYPHLQTDAQVGARIVSGLRLIVEGLNLNNEVFGFYNGSPQYLTQREYYKPTYSAGLRWTSGSAR